MRTRARILGALVIVLPLFAVSRFASADPATSDSVFLARELNLNFLPEDVFFLIREGSSGTMRRVPGVALSLGSRGTDGPQKIIAAARVPRGSSGSLDFSVLVIGKANQIEMTAPQTEDLLSRPPYFDTPEALHEEISSRKEVLTSFKLQVQTQDESLRRLRQDAEVIGNFGRVMEVSDDVERLRAEAAVIEQSSANLENLIRVASSSQNGKGSPAREAALTRQLAELAEASKQAEAGEINRKSGMEAALRAKLDVVESSRFEDKELLERQLAELRSQRSSLEAARGRGASPGTPLPVSPEVDY